MERQITIIGNGYIGSAISSALSDHFDIRVLSRGDTHCEERIAELVPPDSIIINAAGFSGRKNIDDCEEEFDATLRDNFDLSRMIADVSFRRRARLIQLSTGCIYDGDQASLFYEDDVPNLLDGVYRLTKFMAESYVMRSAFEPISLRIRLPFDGRVHPRNLFSKLSAYPVLVNHTNSVTSVDDLVALIMFIMRKKHFASGIYHATNPHFVDTKFIATHLHLRNAWMNDARLDKLVKVKRSKCVLSSKKLFDAGFVFPFAPYAVAKAAESYRNSVNAR